MLISLCQKMYFFAKIEYSGAIFIHCIAGYKRISNYQASTNISDIPEKESRIKTSQVNF